MSIANRVRVAVEDRILTAPNPFFQPVFASVHDDAVEQAVNRIRETAAWETAGIVSRDVCSAIVAETTRAFDGARPGLRTSVNERTGIGQVHNPFRLHPAVLELATHPLLLSIIERYLRRRIYLADVDMRRVPPMSMTELDERAGTRSIGYTSSHWHRDIRGRQVKIMIYLTDVGEGDSNFAYFPGSHRGVQFRPARIEESRFSEQQASAMGMSVADCYGLAGTTLVFDTNALHRLRRRPTATVRDSITYYYTPGQELRTLDVDAGELSRLPEKMRALFGGARPLTQ
jgi:ectoine hydroxylase-related dioxygenase (phytanoyl-CoA dioxygenase family)